MLVFFTVFQIHFLRDSDSGRETGKKRLRDQLLTDACNWKQDVSSDSGKGDVLNEFDRLMCFGKSHVMLTQTIIVV